MIREESEEVIASAEFLKCCIIHHWRWITTCLRKWLNPAATVGAHAASTLLLNQCITCCVHCSFYLQKMVMMHSGNNDFLHLQEHEESEEITAGQQPSKPKDKAGLLSKALRAPLGTRTLSLHNLLDQAPFLEGQQVCICTDLLCIFAMQLLPCCDKSKACGRRAAGMSSMVHVPIETGSAMMHRTASCFVLSMLCVPSIQRWAL